jgi:hypothetical protein
MEKVPTAPGTAVVARLRRALPVQLEIQTAGDPAAGLVEGLPAGVGQFLAGL